MSGRLPDAFIEDLLARTDIVDVIERRVPLKRAGNEFQALCPFHNEKSPSFTVSPSKQFYHCFGCGAHGSAIGFLMQYEGLEFRDAVEDLAKLAGVEVPQGEGGRPSRPRDGLLDLMQNVASHFQQTLKGHSPAVDYLKQRGLSGEVCRDFGVGYAPAGWDGLLKQFGGTPETRELLKRGGLLSEGDRGVYDKFRDRIMFPIHDRRGRVIGFGGRAITDNGPKYLNSPETELFHKGRELYGLWLARKRASRDEPLLVVEGYMDVVALAQFGFPNAVATLGTATTSDQAAILLRATDVVIFCFDGDAAGRKAAWKALLATLPKLQPGKQAKFLFLPDGEDPDSLIRAQGEAAFRALLQEAQPLSDFFFDRLMADVDMDSLDGRAQLVQLARPHLESLPEGVFQDMMLERLESLARHRLQPLASEPKVRTEPRSSGRVGAPPAQQRTPMRLALALLMQHPQLVSEAGTLAALEDSDLPGLPLLRELVDFCRQRPNLTTAQLMELLRDHEAYTHLVKLAVWNLPGEPERLAFEFRDALAQLRLKTVEKSLHGLQRGGTMDDAQKARYRALLAEEQELKNSLRGRKS